MNPPPKKIQSFFRPKQPPAHPSSSAAFTSDPFEPLPPSSSRAAPPTPRILAVEIPPSVLRPVAFRVFTKKHNLTLKSDALALLCALVGRRCGADWRDSGTGERLLDEVARGWRRAEGAQGVLVDGGEALKSVIRALEGLAQAQAQAEAAGFEAAVDGRRFLKVVDAFAMPKWAYNPLKRGFEKAPKPSLLPPASAKTALFRTRYALLHQRLLRTELFLPPTFSGAITTTTTTDAASQKQQQHNKLTPIANLLGRAGQSFLLFGMLAVNPSGVLTLADPTGDIVLDLSIAAAVPADGSWFAPGCFCIVDGAFEEDGRFTAYTVGQPLPERREASAEVWGHVDFLGNGVTLEMGGGGGGQQGRAMRKAEEEEGVRMVFLGAVELDAKGVLGGLRRVFELLQEAPPLVVVLIGSFTSIAMGTNGGSVAYKEYFDRLASLLADFPALTEAASFVFVPGDNDPWASTFSGGASAALPRRAVPEMFTGRVRRVFQGAAAGGGGGGEAVWTSNPCRVGYFTQEVVVCRDDVVGRLRRNGVGFGKGGMEPAMQPFALTYEGCNVMNPGRLVERRRVRWIEYRPATGRGKVVECAL
ncbi:DNA polymerase alpha/epsilon subunit B-domain-containing protein [Morchella snyderi]|nr:DNA polymerase alpha/epsilon subunit B-domain-containing protein [Morchella snyderi]